MLVEGFNGYVEESVQRLNGGFGVPEAMMAILTFSYLLSINRWKRSIHITSIIKSLRFSESVCILYSGIIPYFPPGWQEHLSAFLI